MKGRSFCLSQRPAALRLVIFIHDHGTLLSNNHTGIQEQHWFRLF